MLTIPQFQALLRQCVELPSDTPAKQARNAQRAIALTSPELLAALEAAAWAAIYDTNRPHALAELVNDPASPLYPDRRALLRAVTNAR